MITFGLILRDWRLCIRMVWREGNSHRWKAQRLVVIWTTRQIDTISQETLRREPTYLATYVAIPLGETQVDLLEWYPVVVFFKGCLKGERRFGLVRINRHMRISQIMQLP
ncbi:hypothetical protein [Crucivirus-506]|nr:hypothetical protein [Crucivirus-505]QMW68995.1 hypothetical protein [Crucivirus-506]